MVPAEYWQGLDPTTPYLPRDFGSDRFTHCARGLDLLLQAASTFYRDVPGEFLLLVIDEQRVAAEIGYENASPHIYGPLNRDAIIAVHTMGRQDDGRFELPAGIGKPSGR